MEFPDLGQHCSDTSCNRLDFLPMKCDACERLFCKDHIRYDDHQCASAYKKDVQVPVCPLCGKPVPVPRGETPDIKVGEHIDRDCQSDPAKKKRNAFSNRCKAPRCKQKELIPVICDKCRLNFCIRHRHPQDHDCKGFQGTGKSISNSGYAALLRKEPAASKSKPQSARSSSRSNPPQQTYLSNVGIELNRERQQRREHNAKMLQNNVSEDEALARALQLSLESDNKPMTQEERDLALAKQLQEEEEANRNRTREQDQSRRNRTTESSCKVS